MIFGALPLDEAIGAVVAHTVRGAGLVLKKGEIVTPEAAAALAASGVAEIVVAKLEAGDIGEDEAARLLADRLKGDNLRADRAFTGRCNLFATRAGVLRVDEAAALGLNTVDEAITLATLPDWRAVVEGEMVATVKIIPFAAPRALVEAALARARPIRVEPFRPLRVGVVSTLSPGLKPSVVAKTVAALRERLAPAAATIVAELQTPHETAPLAAALRDLAPRCDLLIAYGASAITDRRDVIPAALEAAGGRIEHLGMPVDPGNLLLIGALDGRPTLGAPGCARSPRENGFDWVLQRLLAGLTVEREDIQRMGVGGLLMEIISRPQPRAGGESRDE